MVKAGDIGKKPADFLSKDFFSNNEVKITTGCCSNKHTTNYKWGDAMKADYKIECAKSANCPLNGPISYKILSDSSAELELKHKVADVNLSYKFNSSLASFDYKNIAMEKSFDYSRELPAGIAMCFDGKIRTKGFGLGKSDVGVSFEKEGIQFGYTTTIPDLLSPAAVDNCKIRLGYAKCSHFQVFAETADCKSVLLRGFLNKDGKTWAAEFNSADLKCAIARDIPFGKVKISSDALLTGYSKTPINDKVAFKSSSTINLKTGVMSGVGLGLEFDL